MDRATVKFNRMLMGAKAHETVNIFNKEHIPFSFSFSQSTIERDGQADVLTLTPTSGVIGPGASCPIEVAFAPKENKFYNFNVLCNIKRRAQPISLNVKGEGYKIHTKLILEQKDCGTSWCPTRLCRIIEATLLNVVRGETPRETRSNSLSLRGVSGLFAPCAKFLWNRMMRKPLDVFGK